MSKSSPSQSCVDSSKSLRAPSVDDEEYWERHLTNWEQSGLSLAAYCRRHKVNYKRLHYWKMQLRDYPRGSSSVKLVEVKRDALLNTESCSSSYGSSGPSSPSPSSASAVGMPSSGLRVWYGDFCIEVSDNFSPAVLSRLVVTLQRLPEALQGLPGAENRV